MADRASVFEGVQLGVEATPGTVVAANRKLAALRIEPEVRAEVRTFRPLGNKFATVAAPSKEWTEAKLSGPVTYTEIVYLLSSVLGGTTPVSPVEAPNVYRWLFQPDSDDVDIPKTYTVEQGSALGAHRFSYGLVTGLGMRVSRDEMSLSGTMMARPLQEGVAMTATTTAVRLEPVIPNQVSVYLADSVGGLELASPLARALRAEWRIRGRFGPIWALNRSSASWAGHIEREPEATAALLLEADAVGMALLSAMRAGTTKFMRIEAIGREIQPGHLHEITIDLALKVTNVGEFRDEDGLFAIEWEFAVIHDTAWGRAMNVWVQNGVGLL
jgi:hypothetical protein